MALKKRESLLFQRMRKNIKKAHFTRIESSTVQGIPDVHVSLFGLKWSQLRTSFRYCLSSKWLGVMSIKEMVEMYSCCTRPSRTELWNFTKCPVRWIPRPHPRFLVPSFCFIAHRTLYRPWPGASSGCSWWEIVLDSETSFDIKEKSIRITKE